MTIVAYGYGLNSDLTGNITGAILAKNVGVEVSPREYHAVLQPRQQDVVRATTSKSVNTAARQHTLVLPSRGITVVRRT